MNFKAWISPEILTWSSFPLYRSAELITYGIDQTSKAYQIWSHAENIFQNHTDEMYMVDVISNLKRSLSHRLTLISKTYELKKITLPDFPKKTIEQLAFLGLVRPTMLKRLIDIRNMVEHEFVTPPDPDRCIELIDFVWYFLRSTDSFVNQVPDGVVFVRKPSDNYFADPDIHIDIVVGPNDAWGEIKFNGQIPRELISFDFQPPDWLLCDIVQIIDPKALITGENFNKNMSDVVLVFDGHLLQCDMDRFIKLYFGTFC